MNEGRKGEGDKRNLITSEVVQQTCTSERVMAEERVSRRGAQEKEREKR